jgi:hypothetical protein
MEILNVKGSTSYGIAYNNKLYFIDRVIRLEEFTKSDIISRQVIRPDTLSDLFSGIPFRIIKRLVKDLDLAILESILPENKWLCGVIDETDCYRLLTYTKNQKVISLFLGAEQHHIRAMVACKGSESDRKKLALDDSHRVRASVAGHAATLTLANKMVTDPNARVADIAINRCGELKFAEPLS